MGFGFTAAQVPEALQRTSAPLSKSYQELKTGLHRDLLNKIDLERLTSMQDVRARTQVQTVIQDLLGASNLWPSGILAGVGLFGAGALVSRVTARSWWFSGLRQLLPASVRRAGRHTRTYQCRVQGRGAPAPHH